MIGQANGHRRHLATPVIERSSARLRSAAERLWSNPFSRGGLALLVNTGLTGILGFAYWIIAARLFSTYAVGVAGALVAATTLFSGLGQLNLSGMLMRFLPRAHRKSRRLVLLTYTYAAGAAAALATFSLIAMRSFASPTSPLRLEAIESVCFVLAVAATAIFTIQDSVLIAARRATWVPVENGGFGLAKIGFLFAFAPLGTAFAVFGAWMIPLTLTIPIISAVLFHRLLPERRGPRGTILGKRIRKRIIRFAIGDATAGLFTQACTYLPPLIITASLGPSENALYFISFLFSSTIDQIAANYASPLTVEAVHSPGEIAKLIRSALRQVFVIIVPVVASLIVICPWLLNAFGAKYADATPFMRLLLIACLPKAISTIYCAYCRIQRTTHKSAMLQAYICIMTLSTIVLLAHPFGLTGICLAILAVQMSAGCVSWITLRRHLRVMEHENISPGRHRRRQLLGKAWLCIKRQGCELNACDATYR
jgi:O-antigen/teichoic acid export membrane protein